MKTLFLCLFLIAAFAFIRPPQENYTVGEVLRKARQLDRDSSTVRLTGYFTRKLSKGWYQFADRTAEIKVYVDDKYLPSKPLDDRISMILYASVEYEQNKPVTLKANKLITEE
ncbi:OB fold (BOF) protein [Chitinophaga dinghuensis]|uniref:OB fold (BOF) protein n=1 Tax=Chitinophaga dinghuensis TaxID=1539050 RepID=A0A327VZC1_9BACT|nr:NirD/YgiW/YdeI family stress tolerance protein [Chitinophaga dinghuensis]RAJ82339.1 OB fold (BOF) protein [Chitinophaga dinghuensis]